MHIPLPPVILLACILLAKIVDVFSPIFIIIPQQLQFLGFVFMAMGIVLGGWSSYLFYKKKTAIHPKGKPKKLILEGVFKLSRNPIYLGMVLILIGVAWYLGSLSSFITPLIYVFLVGKFVIPDEENVLEKTFGQDYLAYSAKVRRWI